MFGKKKKEKVPVFSQLPLLPDLPKLPSFNTGEEFKLHELPSFPNSNFGDKFSQNNIKSAISGRDFDEEDNENEFQKFPEIKQEILPLKIASTRELMSKKDLDQMMPKESKKDLDQMMPKKIISMEPVFVQIDKFEESILVFKKIKKNIEEIEELLKETKNLKQKEEQELSLWEKEVQEMKNEIEKIDRDIFSKI